MKFVFILCFLLVVQYVFTFIQVRYYRKSMSTIVSAYREKKGYYLFSGTERRKFRPGAIVMIVVDRNYIIQECYVINGFSILSKFKEISKYKGQHIGTVLDALQEYKTNQKGNDRRLPALHTALSKVAENALLSISAKKSLCFNGKEC
ncbi:transcriptional regulator GutM [Bacillus vallismortis]|uniref:transcriptional regulator GutM n=1 Tax=Bacillus vallismortis TaxID=72361 RepID=UPI00227FE4B8|nr:transcriptional regulator GutM [Bacillus vallismortis]MCY8547438.1 transcriptional regulator GutM [Bacillus vallismortis]